MWRLVCPLHRQDSQELYRQEHLSLHHPVLRMGCASSVVTQDTVLETAGRVRINLHCLPTSLATTMPGLLRVVLGLTMLI